MIRQIRDYMRENKGISINERMGQIRDYARQIRDDIKEVPLADRVYVGTGLAAIVIGVAVTVFSIKNLDSKLEEGRKIYESKMEKIVEKYYLKK